MTKCTIVQSISRVLPPKTISACRGLRRECDQFFFSSTWHYNNNPDLGTSRNRTRKVSTYIAWSVKNPFSIDFLLDHNDLKIFPVTAVTHNAVIRIANGTAGNGWAARRGAAAEFRSYLIIIIILHTRVIRVVHGRTTHTRDRVWFLIRAQCAENTFFGRVCRH